MSRRAHVPAPFQKFMPSIARGVGPRLLLLAGACAALVLVSSGSYLLAHTGGPQPKPAPKQQAHAPTANAAAYTPVQQLPAPATTPSTPSAAPANPGSTMNSTGSEGAVAVPKLTHAPVSVTPAALPQTVKSLTQAVTSPLHQVGGSVQNVLGNLGL